ncbi:MAG: hypothetical protein AAGF12_38985 [Myxococcota bacterium]
MWPLLTALMLSLTACGSGDPAVSEKVTTATEPLPPEPARDLQCRQRRDRPLLAMFIEPGPGEQYQERVTVFCNGEVELEAPMPFHPRLRSRPGDHRTELSAEELEAAQALALRFVAEPSPNAPPRRTRTAIQIYTAPESPSQPLVVHASRDDEALTLYRRLLLRALEREG